MDYTKKDSAELQAEIEQLNSEYARYTSMGLKLDMSRGKPSPEQLDLSLGLLNITDFKDDSGVDARNYGNLEGLPEARRFFAQLLGANPELTIVGGNSSLELMYHTIAMAMQTVLPGADKAWKDYPKLKFLCPSPGYDRHFRVTEVFGFDLIQVPMTPDGPDMDIVEELVRDPSVKGIWCVPLYSNPDGFTYSDKTVERLASMAAAPDFRVFWDNAYGVHHLFEHTDHCKNILDECTKAGNDNRPFIYCSTSKVTFAGAGVAAMAASAANTKAMLDYLFSVTICFDKINQLRHVRFFQAEGGIARHMMKHADILIPKFETVWDTFEKGLSPYGNIASWTKPKGGYFISLYTLKGCAKRTVELCKKAGVTLTAAGAAFPYGKDHDDYHIRIAPTFPSVAELKTAAELLCIALRLASAEKLYNAMQ